MIRLARARPTFKAQNSNRLRGVVLENFQYISNEKHSFVGVLGKVSFGKAPLLSSSFTAGALPEVANLEAHEEEDYDSDDER